MGLVRLVLAVVVTSANLFAIDAQWWDSDSDFDPPDYGLGGNLGGNKYFKF